ncbi:hypothetical protein [Bacillus sp. SD088]|uniref:hypothetical protein n=1 Tax=Bacillus sp. SD088 TaxID=2782012 RepID=UPI001A9746AB|nr:hypothetical protein [Bacillus sp. SD088]MBO0991885.1 hypothetical protein [Bacillus sp. SD088]
MNRLLLILLLLFVVLVAGCQSSSQIDPKELEHYKVEQTEDQVKQGDFIFRLVSEKDEYSKDEEVKLYGEIEYVGEKKGSCDRSFCLRHFIPNRRKGAWLSDS